MASNQPVISSPAVLNTDPDVDEYGVVARVTGIVFVEPPVPSQQRRFDIGNTVIYIGYAARGVVDAQVAWTIKRIQLVAGNPTTLQWTDKNGTSWDNRVAATYT
jgi:hypothetical protein